MMNDRSDAFKRAMKRARKLMDSRDSNSDQMRADWQRGRDIMLEVIAEALIELVAWQEAGNA